MNSVSLTSFRLCPSSPSTRVGNSGTPRVQFYRFFRLSRRQTGVSRLIAHASAPDPEQIKKMQESMNEAMQDPQVKERMSQMQEALKNPQVRQQMEQTMAYMQNKDTQKRMKEMREDPELKAKFDEIQKGGFGAIMKAMNDVEFLEKVGRRVGPPPGMTPPPSPPPSTTEEPPSSPTTEEPTMPEINTLLDAAKYGDLEAVEDFLAIGKDPNLVDEFDRTPLHFAVSIQHIEIIDALVSSGADLEKKDSKQNTPLHYAVGYGRVEALKFLLEAGADGSAKNETGKTPADLARLSDKNPVLEDEDLINKLDDLAKST